MDIVENLCEYMSLPRPNTILIRFIRYIQYIEMNYGWNYVEISARLTTIANIVGNALKWLKCDIVVKIFINHKTQTMCFFLSLHSIRHITLKKANENKNTTNKSWNRSKNQFYYELFQTLSIILCLFDVFFSSFTCLACVFSFSFYSSIFHKRISKWENREKNALPQNIMV